MVKTGPATEGVRRPYSTGVIGAQLAKPQTECWWLPNGRSWIDRRESSTNRRQLASELMAVFALATMVRVCYAAADGLPADRSLEAKGIIEYSFAFLSKDKPIPDYSETNLWRVMLAYDEVYIECRPVTNEYPLWWHRATDNYGMTGVYSRKPGQGSQLEPGVNRGWNDGSVWVSQYPNPVPGLSRCEFLWLEFGALRSYQQRSNDWHSVLGCFGVGRVDDQPKPAVDWSAREDWRYGFAHYSESMVCARSQGQPSWQEASFRVLAWTNLDGFAVPVSALTTITNRQYERPQQIGKPIWMKQTRVAVTSISFLPRQPLSSVLQGAVVIYDQHVPGRSGEDIGAVFKTTNALVNSMGMVNAKPVASLGPGRNIGLSRGARIAWTSAFLGVVTVLWVLTVRRQHNKHNTGKDPGKGKQI